MGKRGNTNFYCMDFSVKAQDSCFFAFLEREHTGKEKLVNTDFNFVNSGIFYAKFRSEVTFDRYFILY